MIRAVSTHAWLLLTLRHNGEGLPTKGLALIFYAVAVAMAMQRWGYSLPVCAAGMAFCGWLMALGKAYGIRAASGYFLLSICIDAVAVLAFDGAREDWPRWTLAAWEGLGVFALFGRWKATP